MTRMRPGRLPALALCLGLLAAPAALAQSGSGGGSSGGSSGGSAGISQPGNSLLLGSGSTGGSAGGGTGGGQAGQQATSPGPSGQGRRARTEEQLRGAGVAPSAEQEQQQLRDLNAISRQLTPPGAPVPAPEAERR
jgi:hypothetical protein